MALPSEPPVLLVRWYDLAKWLLERIESFPKSQRFVFGQRLADRSMGLLETLVEASYAPAGGVKRGLLAKASRELETLRWLLRLAHERHLLTPRQYQFACVRVAECGRMLGGWARHSATRAGAGEAPGTTPAVPPLDPAGEGTHPPPP